MKSNPFSLSDVYRETDWMKYKPDFIAIMNDFRMMMSSIKTNYTEANPACGNYNSIHFQRLSEGMLSTKHVHNNRQYERRKFIQM